MSTPLLRGVPKGQKQGPNTEEKWRNRAVCGSEGTDQLNSAGNQLCPRENSPCEMVFLQTPKEALGNRSHGQCGELLLDLIVLRTQVRVLLLQEQRFANVLSEPGWSGEPVGL
jgi:hypothetical protein